MSRKPQSTGTAPNRPNTKTLFILRWVKANGDTDDDSGSGSEWALFDDAGYSFHPTVKSAEEFVEDDRAKRNDLFEREDFPLYVPVPSRSFMNGHCLPLFRVPLPLNHAFHLAATRPPHGLYVPETVTRGELTRLFPDESLRHPRSAKGLSHYAEQAINGAKDKVYYLASQLFWPEQRTPDLW